MSDGIWAALSGAVAQERNLEVVANNVANANTVGFRADRVVFEQALAEAGNDGPAPDAVRFVSVAEIVTDQRAGAMQQTGNSLDVAIEGDGWLAVRTGNGERYTRAGSLATNGDGELMTPDGHLVLAEPPEEGVEPPTIQIPSDAIEIRIATDGQIYADEAALGRLRVVQFETPPQKEGLTLYTGQNPEASDAQVRQGYLESANVNAVTGMNELITVTRSFAAFQKVIDTFRMLDERTARDIAG